MYILLNRIAGSDPFGAQRWNEELRSPFGYFQDSEMHIPPWYWFSSASYVFYFWSPDTTLALS